MRLIDDPTLVKMDDNKSLSSFLLGACLAVILLMFGWASVVDDFIQYKTPYSFTDAESNIAELVKAERTTTPDVAIVGSSLSRRLDRGYFSTMRVANMSLGGGSVMTGLELLRQMNPLPKIILVESNILDRTLDEDVFKTVITGTQSKVWVIASGLTKPVRYILGKPIFSYPSQTHDAQWWERKRAKALSSKPEIYDIDKAVSDGLKGWDQRNAWDIANHNMGHIQEIIPEFEAKGVKVYLMYLPYSPRYDHHTFAIKNRIIASGNEFFECAKCLDIRRLVNVDDLRWADGAHLDDRSVALVANALEQRLKQDIPSN